MTSPILSIHLRHFTHTSGHTTSLHTGPYPYRRHFTHIHDETTPPECLIDSQINPCSGERTSLQTESHRQTSLYTGRKLGPHWVVKANVERDSTQREASHHTAQNVTSHIGHSLKQLLSRKKMLMIGALTLSLTPNNTPRPVDNPSASSSNLCSNGHRQSENVSMEPCCWL